MCWLYPVQGTPPVGGILDLQLAFSSAEQTLTFTASTGNYLYLLTAVAKPLGGVFGVQVPAPSPNPKTDVATANLGMVYGIGQGIQQISMGLGGSWTVKQLTARLGYSWPLADDLFSLAEPSLTYTAAPAALELSLLVTIPAMNINSVNTVLGIASGPAIYLKVSGHPGIDWCCV